MTLYYARYQTPFGNAIAPETLFQTWSHYTENI